MSGYINRLAWIRYHAGKAHTCENDENHKSKRYVWLSISGEPKKDIKDYKQVCIICYRQAIGWTGTTYAKSDNRGKNKKLKEVCIRGHILSGDNIYQQKQRRRCKTCNKHNHKKYRERHAEAIKLRNKKSRNRIQQKIIEL